MKGIGPSHCSVKTNEVACIDLFLSDGDLLCEKIEEEAGEVVSAFRGQEGDPLEHEAADLIYHLLVLLRAGDVELLDVWRELGGRRGR